jgi:hypothetical protein
MPGPTLRPMREFDPFAPAQLHDAEENCIVPWHAARAADFKRKAFFDSDGLVHWEGRAFDGWCESSV